MMSSLRRGEGAPALISGRLRGRSLSDLSAHIACIEWQSCIMVKLAWGKVSVNSRCSDRCW